MYSLFLSHLRTLNFSRFLYEAIQDGPCAHQKSHHRIRFAKEAARKDEQQICAYCGAQIAEIFLGIRQ